MSTATRAPSSARDPVRRAHPYKDFLQPALHRRFSTTALVLLATAYAQSLALSSWSSWLWAWFPLSGAGFRAFVLFFCGLIVIILRIAQFHIGIRTSNSPFETFLYHAGKPKTVETLFSYALAGWLYAQVFRWSVPEDAQLGWITYYPGDRTRLNERALFLVVHLVIVGFVHAVLHLFRDSDRLLLGYARPFANPTASTSSTTTAAAPAPAAAAPSGGRSQLLVTLGLQLPFVLLSSCTRSLAAFFVSVPVYALFLRPIAWRFTLALFRPFYNLPRSTLPPMAKPFASSWGYMPRCFQAAFFFSVLLLVSNTAFSLFLVTEPLKDGKPLTADSKDPNGSLLNGLRSKKPRVQAFAMWELAYIARDFPERRSAIYTDIDRKDGSAWSQICKTCLDVIRSLEARIDPPAAAAAAAAAATAGTAAAPATPVDESGQQAAAPVKRLTRPLREDAIVVATPPKKQTFQNEMEKMVGKMAVDPQTSPRLSPLARKALADTKQRLLEVQRDMSGPANPDSGLQTAARRFLATPVVGWAFRRTFAQRMTAAVLGRPYGEPSVFVNAASALGLLAVHSLQEDTFGNVQRDVATVVRELTRVARKLHDFRATFPTHWTDVEARRACPEVDEIVAALQTALAMLVEAFGPYSRPLRLTATDMRLAKEAASAGREGREEEKPEMEER